MDRSPRCPASRRSMDPEHFDPGSVELRRKPERAHSGSRQRVSWTGGVADQINFVRDLELHS